MRGLRGTCGNPAKGNADSWIVNRGNEAVRSRKRFDGGEAFRPFPFLCRPDALQFVLENDTGFSSAQSRVNVLIEGVHRERVRFHRSNSNLFALEYKEPSRCGKSILGYATKTKSKSSKCTPLPPVASDQSPI